MSNKFYAVKKGRKIGIFESWEECQEQIIGFAGAQYKRFATKVAAEQYLNGKTQTSQDQQSSFNNKYEAIAYTDGSFKKDINQFSYGLVFLSKGKKTTFYEKFDDEDWAKLRNVAGEIMGAQKAMKIAWDNNIKSILICHDYHGISKWCTGEWQTTKLETKSYQTFYLKMAKDINIYFKWVKGHSGNIYNEEADRLANKAFTLKETSKPIV